MAQPIFARVNGKFVCIHIEDILYIEASKNYVRVNLENQSFVIHTSLSQLEEELSHDLFYKIHRSYIVALNKIIAFDHEFVYLTKLKLPLSPLYYELLKSKVNIIGHKKTV